MSKLKYEEIIDNIKEKIQTCQLCEGDIIPSESTLAKDFCVSRVTVRKGLSILTSDGYITPVAGKGYFVNSPQEDKCLLCFEEPFFIERATDSHKLLEFATINADTKTARRLGIEPGCKVKYIKYLYYQNDVPVAYDIKYIPNNASLPEDPVYYVNNLDNPSGIFLHKNRELHIWAAITTDEDMKSLQISEAKPVLVIEQILGDESDNVVCWSRLFVIKKYSLVAKS